MTLTEFLLARIAEREAAAKPLDCWPYTGSLFVGYEDERGLWKHGEFNPARVLAECEAKRRIVELHSADHECTAPGDGYAGVFAADGTMPLICPTMLALASVYADHPDYRAEWKP